MNILTQKLQRIATKLKSEGRNDIVILNALKEELHYVILDFLYGNSSYSHLVMYGGTLLRIAYELPRMSEDLDFQTDKKFDFRKFGEEITKHFKSVWDISIEVTPPKSGPTDTTFIRFPHLLNELKDYNGNRTVLRIRFDVNYFLNSANFDTEAIPIVRDYLTFSVKTYPLSTLMASKIGAIFLRLKRGIGTEISDCKPRDIFDIMWYMGKKIIPNLDYLRMIFDRGTKVLSAKNTLELFDDLTRYVVNLDDNVFQVDLVPLFYNPLEYDEWHRHWRERFLMLRKSYEIYRVQSLQSVWVAKDFDTENRNFRFIFSTNNPGVMINFEFSLAKFWYIFADFKISGHRRKDFKISGSENFTDQDYEYFWLFYTKIEDYLKRNDNIVLQLRISTKLIRTTGDNLNLNTQILLSRELLETAKLEDLM